MKIIRNNIIPFKGFAAINICGVLFARKNANLSPITIQHEKIHTLQIKEMWYIFFYLWYVIEWFIRLFMKGNAYRNISFEREAYANQANPRYMWPHVRKRFEWTQYLRKT